MRSSSSDRQGSSCSQTGSKVITNQDSNANASKSPSEPQPADPSPSNQRKGSGIIGASFNLMNSLIGETIIAIPAAIREAGLSTGVVMLVLVALVTEYTLYILVSVGISVGCFSYQEVMKKAFGKVGCTAAVVAQLALTFSAMISCIIIVGDTGTRMISGIFLISNTNPPTVLVTPAFIKAACILLVMLPVSLLRNISSLEKFSGVMVFLTAGLQLIVLYKIITLFCPVRCYDFTVLNGSIVEPEAPCCHGNQPSWYVSTWFINFEVFSAIGVLATVYVCHHNVFLIYNSLKNKTMKTFVITSNISVFTSAVFFTMLGMLGYLTFQGNTQGDLLNNYCRSDPVADVARGMFAVIAMLAYPIDVHVAREVLELSLQEVPRKWMICLKGGRLHLWVEHFLYMPLRKSFPRHVFFTLILVGLSAVIGISTDNLELVLGIEGSLADASLVFVFPAAVHLKLSQEKGALSWVKRGISLVVLVFGVLVIFIGTGSAIYRAIVAYPEHVKLYCNEERQMQGWADTLCPTEGFSNLSYSMVGLASSCDCAAVFQANQPTACNITSL